MCRGLWFLITQWYTWWTICSFLGFCVFCAWLDLQRTITKTCLFKYIENYTTKT